MTNEFAIKDLKGLSMFEHREEFIHTMDVEAINLAIEALNRRTPEKVYKTNGFYNCPFCNSILNYKTHYCDRCGQALDWTEVAE